MKVFHATKELRSPTEMNGKLGNNLRFNVMFIPGKDVEISEKEYDVLSKDEIFQYLVDEGILKEIAKASKKTSFEISQENFEKAEEAQNKAQTEEEKKAAAENLKKAKAELKKAEKKGK